MWGKVGLLVEVVTLLSERETSPTLAASETPAENGENAPLDETTQPDAGEKQSIDEDIQAGSDD